MQFFRKYKNVLSALSINAIESFDFVLYGYYATLIAPVFFSDQNPKAAQLKALLIFAAMFIIKPLGGLIFGHIGDKHGRKKSLITSVLVISIPTFFIGILPGYEQLGSLAPTLLVILLSIQGLGAAAANSGAAIFLNEHAKPNTKAFFSGLLFSAAFMGAAMASLLGIFFVSHYPDWGWRAVFVIGSILGLLILVLRNTIEETPLFQNSYKNKAIKTKIPFREILKKHKRNLMATMGIAAGANLPFYIILIYINTILSSDLHISSANILMYNVFILLFWSISLPFFGHLGDKVGERRLMLTASVLLIIVPIPLMKWFVSEKTVFSLMTGRVILSLVAMGVVAPCSAYLARLFPVHERQTGVGFGYFTGSAIFGGTAPSICLYCTQAFNIELFPAIYLAFGGAISLLSLWVSKPQDTTY